MPIYTPTGVKRFEDLPILTVDEQNENNIELITIDSQGSMYRTPIPSLKNYVGVSYTDLLVDNEEQIILGRYSTGSGNIQKLTIGDNISLNSTTGLLDSTITIGGNAGGDFEGLFPSPNLKLHSITLDKLAPIPGNTILGRGGELEGEVEVIRIGSEFTIDPDTNTLHLTAVTGNMVDTGWITFHRSQDFVCVPSAMYFVSPLAEETITVTIPSGWLSGQQIVVINKGEGNVLLNLPNEFIDFETNNIRAVNLICDGSDGFFNI